jgi:hypothetical protein
MMSRSRSVALWPIAGALLGFALYQHPVPAQGHTAGTFYGVTYFPNSTEHWLIDDGVPNGDFRESVKFGIGQWDDGAGGIGPNYVFDGEIVSNSGDLNPCNGANRSVVFVKEDLSIAVGAPYEVLGYADFCLEGPPTGTQYVNKFEMYLETTPETGGSAGWYVGSGTPPSNRDDLRSVVTHETGHTTGWVGHFTGSTLCNPNDMATYHTMCATVPPLGTTGWRYLEAHDLHTYDNAY